MCELLGDIIRHGHFRTTTVYFSSITFQVQTAFLKKSAHLCECGLSACVDMLCMYLFKDKGHLILSTTQGLGSKTQLGQQWWDVSHVGYHPND